MANADPLLVVGLTLLMFIMLIVNIYLLAYWQHPEDKNESILVRLLIIYGLQLSAVSVLMIPVGKFNEASWNIILRLLTYILSIDVANDGGNPACDPSSLLNQGTDAYCGGIDMFSVWETFFCMLCFSVVVFIPFATFYYEADSVDLRDATIKKSRLMPALCQESVVITFFLVLVLALYFTKSYAEIPVEEFSYPVESLVLQNFTRTAGSSPYTFLDQTLPSSYIDSATVTKASFIMPVSFAVYLIGLFSWVAWWMFAIFLGTGLTCTPLDLIISYMWRPRVMAPDAMANKELELQEKTAELLEITSLLKRERTNLNDGSWQSKLAMRRRYLSDRMEVNRLTQMVFILERDLEELRACKELRRGYNPLVPYVKLGLGVFFAGLSVLWLLQIVLAVITTPPVTPFLSLYLITFDVWFPMFGNLTYALFSLYLLFCTVKGCFKLSVRLLCCKIHPMQPHGTYVNAFLFNLGIVMTCTVPLVHFCVLAFAGYAVNTDVFFLFVVQVNNINFFSIFFRNNVFIWMIMLISFMLLPYFLWRPRDVATSTEDFRRNLADRASGHNYSPLAKKSRGGDNAGEMTKEVIKMYI
jgi:LMBR1 domain-containing protein 1